MKKIMVLLVFSWLFTNSVLAQSKDPSLKWEGEIGYIEIRDSEVTNSNGVALSEVIIWRPIVVNGLFLQTYLGVIDHRSKILVTNHSEIVGANLFYLNGRKVSASCTYRDGTYRYCSELILVIQDDD